MVPDDDLVEEPFEEHCDEPSGTRTPPTPDVSPSHAPPKLELNTETQIRWANMTSCQYCPTNVRGFYMSFMISCSLAWMIEGWICHPSADRRDFDVHGAIDNDKVWLVFGLAVEHAIIHGVDLCSSFLVSIKLAHEICANISFFFN